MKKHPILVVGFETHMAKLASRILGRKGVQVKEASSWQEALAMASQMTFDYVIVDARRVEIIEEVAQLELAVACGAECRLIILRSDAGRGGPPMGPTAFADVLKDFG